MLNLFAPKLPITDAERIWIDDALAKQIALFGKERAQRVPAIVPDIKYFPQEYDGSEAWAEMVMLHVCRYMEVDRERVLLDWYEVVNPDEDLRNSMPHWKSSGGKSSSGLYSKAAGGDRVHIRINRNNLSDPMALIGTVAHELCHVILLGDGLISRDEPDMEPFTDLLTVFLGLGIFTANTAFRFSQWSGDQRGGWSVQKLGYLGEPMYGYALARWARLRNEEKPDWSRYLKLNVREYMDKSGKWLKKNLPGDPQPRTRAEAAQWEASRTAESDL